MLNINLGGSGNIDRCSLIKADFTGKKQITHNILPDIFTYLF